METLSCGPIRRRSTISKWAGGPRLPLIQDPEQHEAGDEAGPGGRGGEPGDEDAGHLVDADDLRVLGAEAALDDAGGPQAHQRDRERRDRDRDRAVGAQNEIERDGAGGAGSAGGDGDVAAAESP